MHSLFIGLCVGLFLTIGTAPGAYSLSVYDSATNTIEEMETDFGLVSIEGQQKTEDENWVQEDSEQYPLSSVVYIKYKGNCSGTLIGPYTVLTAAHCFPFGFNTTPADVIVYAGGKEANKAKGTRIFISLKYHGSLSYDQSSIAADWAIIVLNKPLGKKNGYLGIKTASLQVGDKIQVLGFPGSKDHSRPWNSSGKISELSQENDILYHTAKTEKGNSGGPILLKDDLSALVGIATFAQEDPYLGGGTVANEELVSFVMAHRDKTPNSK